MRKNLLILCSALIVAASATALAQQAFVPPPPGVRFLERYRPANAKGDTKIIGTVIDIRQVPVKGARVQLRDLATGLVEQEGTSNENGEYEFNVLNPSTYVVEMVMVDGYVVALSNAGSLGRFETLNTVVQLPGRWDLPSQRVVFDQTMSSYLGVSAQTTMTATTLAIAVEQNIAPRASGEPVSP